MGDNSGLCSHRFLSSSMALPSLGLEMRQGNEKGTRGGCLQAPNFDSHGGQDFHTSLSLLSAHRNGVHSARTSSWRCWQACWMAWMWGVRQPSRMSRRRASWRRSGQRWGVLLSSRSGTARHPARTSSGKPSPPASAAQPGLASLQTPSLQLTFLVHPAPSLCPAPPQNKAWRLGGVSVPLSGAATAGRGGAGRDPRVFWSSREALWPVWERALRPWGEPCEGDAAVSKAAAAASSAFEGPDGCAVRCWAAGAVPHGKGPQC